MRGDAVFDPSGTYRYRLDPIGAENDRHIAAAAARADLVVCAWGGAGALEGRDRAVRRILRRYRTVCLGLTGGGMPRHPLYVPAATRPLAFGGS